MRGFDFKRIRKFNKIAQEQVAFACGFKSHALISKIENQSHVPQRFIIALSQLIGFDLTKDEVLQKILSEIPEDYQKIYRIERDRMFRLRPLRFSMGQTIREEQIYYPKSD